MGNFIFCAVKMFTTFRTPKHHKGSVPLRIFWFNYDRNGRDRKVCLHLLENLLGILHFLYSNSVKDQNNH